MENLRLVCSPMLNIMIYSVNEQIKQRKLKRQRILRYVYRTIGYLSNILVIIEVIKILVRILRVI